MAELARSPRRAAAATSGLVLLAVLLIAAVGAPLATAAPRPTAVVAMGDSFISGEAAGEYEPASNRPGDYCHRSRRALIHKTSIPGIEQTVSLACSGAATDNVKLGGEVRYGEAPQAEQLRTVARDRDVKLILLNIGANDIGFANAVMACIVAFVPGRPDCQDDLAPTIRERSQAAIPRIVENLRDIRTVMREAGYADDAYQLAVMGYASPVPARMRSLSWLGQIWAGCPIDRKAMIWAHDWAIEQFSAMTATAAAQAGVRYLELKGAFDGHEVCAAGATARTEWVRGTFVDPAQLPHGVGMNVVQQSMHPHHLGHAQMGRCVTGFFSLPGREARCAIGADGNLHAT
jgi:lysophospholipase L1-like esterase